MWRFCFLASLASCGHRVAEPDASPGAVVAFGKTPAALASGPATEHVMPKATAATSQAQNAAPRCLVPTPATPARPAPPKGPDPSCPNDPDGSPVLRHATVRVSGAAANVDAEIAEHDAERQRGLMFRKQLGENEGMLFVFEAERVLAFWMHNTCLALDMLFIASDGTIIGIEENVPTLNDDTYAPGDCASRYVLEVNAGWAHRHGVKAGQKLLFGGL